MEGVREGQGAVRDDFSCLFLVRVPFQYFGPEPPSSPFVRHCHHRSWSYLVAKSVPPKQITAITTIAMDETTTSTPNRLGILQ